MKDLRGLEGIQPWLSAFIDSLGFGRTGTNCDATWSPPFAEDQASDMLTIASVT
jgi:hypothetical protein